jgi:hypothetical protein
MINVNLELDELILLADLCHRSKGDFEPHLYYELDEIRIEGYASVAMLQMHNRLELLERKLGQAAPEPLEFCTATQSLRLESQCEWRKHQAEKEASE